MYYVYILKSKVDEKLYIGQTVNLEERLKTHNRGKVISTKKRRPFVILTAKTFLTRTEAVQVEKYLKIQKGGNGLQKALNHWGFAKW